ncbi:unnamed protein product [Mytilus coruscus]|uniref:Uncharacterized protein n=1 Tax=Mytilus coruscus TaxID=42192 RepID=A0A6J8DTT2_MYTCO|nr:unnamed protein product [Mytilus coruscus]
MPKYKHWTIQLVNEIEPRLFLDSKDVVQYFADQSLANLQTHVQHITDSNDAIDVCLILEKISETTGEGERICENTENDTTTGIDNDSSTKDKNSETGRKRSSYASKNEKVDTTESKKCTVRLTDIVANTSSISGKILQVQCTGRKKCPSCDKNVEVQDRAEKIKCPSCNLKSNVKSLKESIFIRINIHDYQKKKNAIHRLICFREPLEVFLATQEKSNLIENFEELEDFLLDLKHYVKITCSKDSDIVITIVTADGQF